jgi:hypothetical protein
MFASFKMDKSDIAIAISAENSWDGCNHEARFVPTDQTILGLPSEEYQKRNSGQLYIRIAKAGEPSFKANTTMGNVDIRSALQSGAGLTVEFWEPDINPEQRRLLVQTVHQVAIVSQTYQLG